VIHPTFWLKLFEGFVSTFMVNDTFWTKLRYINHLDDIYNTINHDQLHIPQEIVNYDAQMNGKKSSSNSSSSSSSAVVSARAHVDDL